MNKIIERLKHKKQTKLNRNNNKILSMAIIMFISFSFLNVFLILNFINILNNIATI